MQIYEFWYFTDFFHKGRVNNISTLVQITAWRQPYLNQWLLVYRRTYAPLGLNELKQSFPGSMYFVICLTPNLSFNMPWYVSY